MWTLYLHLSWGFCPQLCLHRFQKEKHEMTMAPCPLILGFGSFTDGRAGGLVLSVVCPQGFPRAAVHICTPLLWIWGSSQAPWEESSASVPSSPCADGP